MIRHFKKMIRDQRGSTLALSALAILLLLSGTGVVIDGGTLYITKSHLQKAANAAVLSGAQELTGQQASVSAVIGDILQKHKEQTNLVSTDIQMKSNVRIHLKKDVTLGFGRLFGYDSLPVTVQAAAQILPMGAATGAAPLGIDESVALEYYKNYKLKVDSSGVDTGNFGILALGGTGSATYEDNLRYGYQNEMKVGDVIDTETGNVSGKTRTSVQYRIDSCPYLPGDYTHRDCPRILLIPVYKPIDSSNQLKHIEVTGFAYFYISEPMSSTDTSISGMFIAKTGTGFVKPGAVDKGAYAIRLIE